MSMDASGTIAKTLTFSKWKGRNYIRRRVIPANPRVDSQYATRSMLRFLSQAWKTVTSLDQASWDAAAASLKISPFNRYLQVNMRNWTQFLTPSTADPATRTGPAAVPIDFTATPGVHQISGTWITGLSPNTWAIAILLFKGTMTVGRNTTRLILPALPNDSGNYTLTELLPGTYEATCLSFDTDGSQSPPFTTITGIIVT
jgi:hypothetical protein